MAGSSPGKDHSTVLIVADDVGLADLFAAWLADLYDVRVAYNCDTAVSEVDATVDVTVLARHLPDSSSDDLVTAIQEWELDCGVAMVTAVHPDADIDTMAFDEYLVTSVGREEIRSTVSRSLRISEYEQRVREVFTVTSKKAFFETHVPASALEQMDEYERLVAHTDQLKAELADFASSFPRHNSTRCGRSLLRRITSGVGQHDRVGDICHNPTATATGRYRGRSAQ